jgi:hypothetical protein
MLRPRLIPAALLCCLSILAGSPGALANWLVYELKLVPDEASSLNFQFYTGAYVVVPVTGGAASLVLTTEDQGRFYAVAEGGARAFTAANPATRRTVISALALNGSAQACYTASGLVNQALSLPSPQGLRSYRVAGTLQGQLIASDDDSEAQTLPADGSLGMVGTARIDGTLRQDLTYNASQYASLADVVLYLTGLLEHYGYAPDNGEPVTAVSTIEGHAIDGSTDASLFPAGSAAAAESPTSR